MADPLTPSLLILFLERGLFLVQLSEVGIISWLQEEQHDLLLKTMVICPMSPILTQTMDICPMSPILTQTGLFLHIKELYLDQIMQLFWNSSTGAPL